MKKFSLLFVFLIFIISSFAQVPDKISWQGILTDDLGDELNGTYNLTFKLFDTQTLGVALFQETHSNVLINNGLANVTLGSVADLDLNFDQQYWLEITINGGTPLSRIPLNSVPYAMYAKNTSNIIEGAALTINDANGNPRIILNPDGSKIHLKDATGNLYFKAEENLLSSKVSSLTDYSELIQSPTAFTFNADNITANGQFFVNNGYLVNGFSVINGMFEVYDHVYFDNTFNVFGEVTFDDDLTVLGLITGDGGATFKNGLSVTTGNVLFSNNLTVSGLSSFTTSSFSGLASFGNGLSVTGGNVLLANNLTVTGSSTMNGAVSFNGGLNVPTGDVGITNKLTVTGLATFNGNLINNGTATLNSGLNVPIGDVGITNKLTVGGLSALQNVTASGSVVLNDGLTVNTTDVSIEKRLLVAGNTRLSGELDLTGPAFLNDNVDIMGDLYGSDIYAENVFVNSDLSVTGEKNFRIDHPDDPYNKYLFHASIESDEVLNLYSGNVTTDGSGVAIVTLPDYIQKINRNFRYQLTVIGDFAQAIIYKELSNNQFEIKTDKPNIKVSWQITCERYDDVMKLKPFAPVRDKESSKKGTRLIDGYRLTK